MISINNGKVRIHGSDEEIQEDLRYLGKALRDMDRQDLKDGAVFRWTMDKVEEKVRLITTTAGLMSLSPEELERIKKEMEEG